MSSTLSRAALGARPSPRAEIESWAVETYDSPASSQASAARERYENATPRTIARAAQRSAIEEMVAEVELDEADWTPRSPRSPSLDEISPTSKKKKASHE